MLNALTFDRGDAVRCRGQRVEHVQHRPERAQSLREPTRGRLARGHPEVQRAEGELRVHLRHPGVGWVAERQSALLRHIHERGHEVACHGQAHQMISAMTPDEVRADVRRAKQTIEDAIGAPSFGYRAPTFSVVRQTLWALDILAEEGFTYDSSIFPIHHNRYGIPDAYRFPHEIPLTAGGSIVEFPMTTVAFAGQRFPFAGGGYFRLLPYAAIRAGLRRLNEHEKQPAIFYIHPWEIDPDQPRLSVSGLNRFRHYVNLRHTAGKLARLLDDFSFGPVRDVLKEYDLVVVPR